MLTVDMGPTMPICAVSDAPMRSIANMINKTGATVQAVALSMARYNTSSGTAMLLRGRNRKN
jgi:hypothetical protein